MGSKTPHQETPAGVDHINVVIFDKKGEEDLVWGDGEVGDLTKDDYGCQVVTTMKTSVHKATNNLCGRFATG